MRSPSVHSLVLIVGGVLIAVEAAFLPPSSGTALYGLILGVAIIVVGLAAVPRPSLGRILGAVGAVLGLVSFFVISGFFLGAILAVIGGATLAVFSQPSWTRVGGGGTSLRPEDLGALCPNCGHRIPPWSAKCPYCATNSGGD